MAATAKKAITCIVFLALLAFVYVRVGTATLARSNTLSLLTPLDAMIPLIPEMVFFYVSVYLFWLPPILLSSFTVREFFRLVFIAGISALLALVIHYHMPSAYPRPMLPKDDPLFAMATLRFYYWLDLPNNTFPSTHCIVVATLLLAMRNRLTRAYSIAYEMWGALIFASTVLVKQHYLVDVLGGIILATIIFLLLRSTPRSSQAYS